MLGDVRFRIAPLTDRDADELLHEIRGFRLLQGYRGHPPADMEALRELLLRVVAAGRRRAGDRRARSQSGDGAAAGNGCRIVDARIRVAAHGVGPAPARSTAARRAVYETGDATGGRPIVALLTEPIGPAAPLTRSPSRATLLRHSVSTSIAQRARTIGVRFGRPGPQSRPVVRCAGYMLRRPGTATATGAWTRTRSCGGWARTGTASVRPKPHGDCVSTAGIRCRSIDP